MHTTKSLDTEIIHRATSQMELVVTLGDYVVIGGLGSAVANVVVNTGADVKAVSLMLPDNRAGIGHPPDLFVSMK